MTLDLHQEFAPHPIAEVLEISFWEQDLRAYAKSWDIQSGSEIRRLIWAGESAYSMDFNEDGSTLVMGVRFSTVLHCDLRALFNYTHDSGPDGLRTVYARLRNNSGQSTPVNAVINLDATAPDPPDRLVWDESQSTFGWTAGIDPDPGCGVPNYDCQIGTWPGQSDVFDDKSATP